MSRIRRLAKKLALSAAFAALVLVAVELVARAAEPGPFSLLDRNPYVSSAVDFHVRHEPGFEGRWDATWYEIDSRGFRGPERTPSFTPGELRITCVGDSCTFGKGVLEAETWPRRLEALLRAGGRDALVHNLGISGASGIVYESYFAEHVDALQPHVVVVGYNINDFPNTIRAIDQQVFEGRRLRNLLSNRTRDALGRLALYRKARQVYYDLKKSRDWEAAELAARTSAAEPLDSEVWRKQRAYLEGIRSRAAAHGGRTMVFLFPYESQVYLDVFDPTPIARLSALCESLDLPFVDLTEAFRSAARAEDPPRKLFLAGDRYHPNAEGYDHVARHVLRTLEGLGWLEAP